MNESLNMAWLRIFVTATLVGVLLAVTAQAGTSKVRHQSEAQHNAVDDVHARVGGELQVRFHEDGGLRHFGARDIAPGCAVPTPVTKADPSALINCFFQISGGLLRHVDEDPRLVPWELVRFSEPDFLGISTAVLRQKYGGVDVRNGEVTFAIRDGRLISFVGKLHRPSRVPQPSRALAVPEQAKAAAEGAFGTALGAAVTRYFDPELQTVVSEFQIPRSSDVLMFDERSRTSLGIRSMKRHVNPEAASIDVTVQNYAGLGAGNPSRWDPPQTVGPATSSNFASDEPPYTTTINIMRSYWGLNCWWMLSQHPRDANSARAEVRDETGGAAWHWDTSCNDSAGFSGYPSSTQSLRAHMYDLFERLAAFAWDPLAGYRAWFPWVTPRTLVVDTPLGDANSRAFFSATANSGHYTINLYRTAFKGLYAPTHEYGHFLAAMMGQSLQGLIDTQNHAVIEGFAEHNVLRYALYRWAKNFPYDPAGRPLIYLEGRNAGMRGRTPFKVKQGLKNGEFVPQEITHPTDTPAFFYGSSTTPVDRAMWAASGPEYACGLLQDSNPPVSRPDPLGAYHCGALVPMLYWLLVHNRFQVDYDYNKGAQIIQSIAVDPNELANFAFTYAIRNFPSTGDIEDFFFRVTEAYYAWTPVGISNADYNRLKSALNTHCLGWSNQCDTNHSLPGARLPVSRTRKGSFDSSPPDDHHLLLMSDVGTLGSPIRRFQPTPDAPVYYEFDDSEDSVWTYVNFAPNPGNQYCFSVAAHPKGPAQDSFFLDIWNVSPWQPEFQNETIHVWNQAPYGEWVWSPGVTLDLDLSGSHFVHLKFREPNTAVQAMVFKEGPCPETVGKASDDN